MPSSLVVMVPSPSVCADQEARREAIDKGGSRPSAIEEETRSARGTLQDIVLLTLVEEGEGLLELWTVSSTCGEHVGACLLTGNLLCMWNAMSVCILVLVDQHTLGLGRQHTLINTQKLQDGGGGRWRDTAVINPASGTGPGDGDDTICSRHRRAHDTHKLLSHDGYGLLGVVV